MAYQLGAKPNNFDDLSSHSKRFRYFFQFLKFQVEEAFFFHEAIVILVSGIELSKQKYNGKVFIFCPFLLLFYPLIHFQTFSYFFQFLPLQAEETYFIQDAITVSWQ